ncbi:MAG: UPF0175 family protein [Bryobacteraceae bacterium]|jgi:predicted HTH domain antitoxin
MQLTIDLPEDVTESLRGTWGDVSRHALEALAVEGYRTGALTETQVKRLLNFETRFQVHALLREFRVPYHYTEEDAADDLATHRDLGILPQR